MEKKQFRERLAELRTQKGVSARDMSLSLGQSPGYINNIENGVNLPSMSVFFYICEYFGITPQEFFDMENKNPTVTRTLTEQSKRLSSEQLDLLLEIIRQFR